MHSAQIGATCLSRALSAASSRRASIEQSRCNMHMGKQYKRGHGGPTKSLGFRKASGVPISSAVFQVPRSGSSLLNPTRPLNRCPASKVHLASQPLAHPAAELSDRCSGARFCAAQLGTERKPQRAKTHRGPYAWRIPTFLVWEFRENYFAHLVGLVEHQQCWFLFGFIHLLRHVSFPKST